jgi:hypothetical protein
MPAWVVRSLLVPIAATMLVWRAGADRSSLRMRRQGASPAISRPSSHTVDMESMQIEMALFDGDELIERGAVDVRVESGCNHLQHFRIAHRLDGDAATVVLSGFSPRIKLRTVTLDVPVHQSTDWESIDLAGYTLAFRCSVDDGQSNPLEHGEDETPA